MNTIALTANPVVSSVILQLASANEDAGIPVNDLLVVNAKDADGNTIVGNSNYVDVNGNAVAFSLNVSNNQVGGRGTVTIKGSSYITAPGQSVIYAYYDGNWLASSTISVSSSSSAVSTLTGATLTITPHVYEYAATAGSGPHGIVVGPDGNIWFTEFNGNMIGRMSTAGTNYTEFSCGACRAPHYITNCPDGNLWFTENFGSYVDKITPAGVATRVVATPGLARKIRAGSDGNLWFCINTGGSSIGKVSVAGILTNYPMSTGIDGVGIGPNGDIWYTTNNATTVGDMSSSGQVLNTYTVSNQFGTFSDGIVTGPDGNVWVTNNSSNQIDRIVPQGLVTAYATVGTGPRNITVGPDGNLWYTESASNSIGNITMSGTVTEYGSASGINTSSGPIDITLGPDGNIWFTELGSNSVGKMVY